MHVCVPLHYRYRHCNIRRVVYSLSTPIPKILLILSFPRGELVPRPPPFIHRIVYSWRVIMTRDFRDWSGGDNRRSRPGRGRHAGRTNHSNRTRHCLMTRSARVVVVQPSSFCCSRIRLCRIDHDQPSFMSRAHITVRNTRKVPRAYTRLIHIFHRFHYRSSSRQALPTPFRRCLHQGGMPVMNLLHRSLTAVVSICSDEPFHFEAVFDFVVVPLPEITVSQIKDKA